ncbi:beta-lactamase family protein [Neohortaea acidophila]|uniref:Beta-lactamase family protein n=1 Tax=Neohortaea acidophila TaxID=245834 RepID=A0A6A6PNI1_9PEZI|nr:beta-lactamase family protein [Neohortaea acidophila]KAF2481465.1 beta-lactamase family protein [Neohortaea acidophila]
MDWFKSPKFAQHVDALMQEWHVPGLGIAIVQDDTIFAQGFGKANVDPQNPKAITGDTVFDIASCSKQLTAAAVALLVADEDFPQVQWDTPVSKLLDDFVLAKPEYTAGVTVEDLVSHRSGLPRHDFSYLSPRAKHPDTLQTITQSLRHLEIVAPIRSKYMYNNMAFSVLAYLVEVVSGQSFEDFLRQRIWDPLDMKSTNIAPKNAIKAGLPLAQPQRWDGEKFIAVESQDSPEAVGAGLVVTSVTDYAKWIRALMHQQAPISQEVYEDLTLPRSIADWDIDEAAPFTSPSLYSAGLESYHYRGHQVIAHNGGDPGVSTITLWLPEQKFGVVIFGNAGDAYYPINVLRHELVDEALGVPHADRTDWRAKQREDKEKDEANEAEQKEKRRKELCPEHEGKAQPQPGSLEPYLGRYWNDGYRGIEVVINEKQKLFVDMSDRTMGFTIEFEHLCDGTKYIAHQSDYYEDEEDETAAEFVFEGERVVKIGLDLEEDLPSRRIWFDRVKESSLAERPKASR